MPIPENLVIVGGGLAGFSMAQELRKRGFGGAVTIVDPEGLPYDRPPLSKEYLDGRQPAEKLPFIEESWYTENNVTLVTDTVTAIDPESLEVTLESGGTLPADEVVLATGGHARKLPIPGGDLPGLRYLRTKADADALREVLVPGKHLAIIGAGLIGAEVASTAVNAGAEVTLIDPVAIPGVAGMGETIALHLHKMHEAHGVHTLVAQTTAFAERDGKYVVEVDGGLNEGGTEVVADAVLVAIGIVPDIHLARDMGLDMDRGVLVDEGQRTSNPKVYAIGDIARLRRADGTLGDRHEHWESATHSGQTAAAALLGQELPVHPAPWMWTDRYGLHVEAVGTMREEGHLVVREKDNVPSLAVLLSDDGHVLGAAAIDGGNAIRAVRRMIDRGIVPDREKLADPSVDLKKLAR